MVLLDLIIGNNDGVEVLKQIKKYDESIGVIVMTAFGSIKTSVDAMKKGAFTYLTKPLDIEELQVYIKQALAVRRLNDDVGFLSNELKLRFQYKEIIGNSLCMQQVYDLIEKLKNVDSNVTITERRNRKRVGRACYTFFRQAQRRTLWL